MRFLAVMLFVLGMIFSETSSQAQDVKPESEETRALRSEMAAMRKELQAQIDLLRSQLAASAIPPSKPGDAAVTVVAAAPVNELPTSVAKIEDHHLESSSVAAVSTVAIATKKPDESQGPSSIRFKGVSLTPGGFLALDSVFRSKSLGADMSTPYFLTPYTGAGSAHTSEWNPSGRQSRISMLAEGNTAFGKLTGYYEADFLQAGSNTNSVQTSSYVLRQRQLLFIAATNSGWTVSGGQMWALATENRKGVDPRTEAAPLVLDAAQSAGFTWGRWAALRIGKKVNDTVATAFALEAPQSIFNATNAPSNFFIGAPGSGPGGFNPGFNYSINPSPDLTLKAAFDPAGRGHYEAGLIGRLFRDRYYPNGGTSGQNDTKAAGGLFASARIPVGSRLEIGGKVVAGRGLGRYGAALLTDVTVKPDGTLAPLQNAQTFVRAEFKATRKLDLFTYNGVEYAGRASYPGTNGTQVGYGIRNGNNTGCLTETPPTSGSGYAPGAPLNCVGAIRLVSEWSGGYQYRFYEGPVGRLQFTAVYGYLTRDAWSGIGGSPRTTNHLVYTGLRYFLP